MDSYITVKKSGSAEIIEKKSRFIAHIFPVNGEEEANEILTSIKKEYWDARHNVYARRIGVNNPNQRYSDDGEPSGTAGLPILEVLTSKNVTNTMVVVTRYFGGILLGTGGLVRAYSKATQLALDTVGLVKMTPFKKIIIKCNYSLSGKIEYTVLKNEGYIKDTMYTDIVTYIITVPENRAAELCKALVEVTAAGCEIEEGSLELMPIDL